MRGHISKNSNNKKCRGLLVTTTSKDTCPDHCVFKKTEGTHYGCYGDGYHTDIHWNKVSEGSRGYPLDAFFSRLRQEAPRGRARVGQVGDCPGDSATSTLDEEKCMAYARAAKRHGKPWGYTHYPVSPMKERLLSFMYQGKERRKVLKEITPKVAKHNASVLLAMLPRLTMNVSCETLKQVDKAMDLGLPAVVVVPKDAPRLQYTPKGRRVAGCPEQLSKDINCANCGGTKGPICWRKDRDYAVSFRAHGVWARLVGLVVNAVAAGEEE